MDTSILTEFASPENIMALYEGLHAQADIMRQIDLDPDMSQVIRDPLNMKQLLKDSGMLPEQGAVAATTTP